MQRYRFFASPAQISSSLITLDADESHHLTRVLRLGPGTQVWVFDGIGNEYRCEVIRCHKRSTELAILATITNQIESPLEVVLAQSLVKSDKFDWIVQKSTELGVTRIVPLVVEHSDTRRIEERTEQRLKRWQRISLEAIKQCGRRRLVEIVEPISWPDYCANDQSQLKFILSERNGSKFTEGIEMPSSISLAIGPEGGWSKTEFELGAEQEFVPIHLGTRILRTETAAITAIALVQYLFGDLH